MGLRREHFGSLLSSLPSEVEWFEVAPENYLEIGGRVYRDFCELTERVPVVFHSISLSLGSLDPLDRNLLKLISKAIKKHKVPMASDHICFSSYNQVQFDDLLPLPFTWEAVRHTAKRIKMVQEILEVPFAVENISYYAPCGAPEMTEADFIRAVIEESDALLLFDVNNVYVNSVNHRFDPHDYIKKIPLDRIAYVHIAGHKRKKKDFVLDTHGEDIIHPVWRLLEEVSKKVALPSVMIERDGNIPPIEDLVGELRNVHHILRRNDTERNIVRVAS